ncbi:hypothetical protein HY500_01570 [Candidatus Woesearchaeota archaeon]|nr:hypothetical protein [Candidatus Woesearchaeota archaeon]
MFNKKSQAAMEFLMTYGWAIMIVLIGIGALFFLGVFNPSTPSTCNIASPFICQDVRIIDTGGAANFIIFRFASTNIDSATINTITLNGIACGSIYVGYNADLSGMLASSDISQSKNKPTYVRCQLQPTVAPYGSKVSGNFNINWVKQFGVSHITIGAYSGTVESN